MSNEKNTLDAMLEQYARNSAPKFTKTEAKVYDKKNYFTTFIPENVKSATKTIRILPLEEGVTPFVEIYTHEGYVDGEKKVFPCLKEERGEPCPYCEARDKFMSTGTDADKKTANNYKARKMFVVKVIDRDHEEDGVKFWRIKDNYKKEGAYDKIFSIFSALKKDISHPDSGRDLVLTINRNDKGCIVSGIAHLDPTPLSEDQAKRDLWLSDTRTWENVYAIKSYDFLKIVVLGGNPVWDSEAKTFVDKNKKAEEVDEVDEDITIGLENVKSNIKVAKETTTKTTKTTKASEPINVAEESSDDEDETDDLPF
jgi:hypothetical protein